MSSNFPDPHFPTSVASPPSFLLVALFVVAGICAVKGPGMTLSVILMIVAVLVFVVLRRALVRPIRRLRDDVQGLAVGGQGQVVRRCRIREVDAVVTALRQWRIPPEDMIEKEGARRRWTVSLGAVSVAVCLLIFGWAVAGIPTAVRPTPAVPTDVHVEENRKLVAAAAESVRLRLEYGLSQVQLAVIPPPGATRGYDLADRMRRLAAHEDVFRSAYVLDRRGTVLAEAGRNPMYTGRRIPATTFGISQLNTTGRAPVIVAFAWVADGTKALVAEFDVLSLRGLLRPVDSHLRIVDSGLRTVLDAQGYRAFAAITDPALRNVAVAASHGASTAQLSEVDNDVAALTALPIGGSEPVAALRWVIVGDRQVGAAAFPDDPVARATLVVVGLGTAAAVIFLTWTWLLVIRPLRRAAEVAAAFSASSAGDAAAVERLDEIGAIVACLNRYRHRWHPGTQRAACPEGGGSVATMVSTDQLLPVGG